MHLFAAEFHSTAELSYLCIYMELSDHVFDTVGLTRFRSKINVSLLACPALTFSCLLLFSLPSMGWFSGLT